MLPQISNTRAFAFHELLQYSLATLGHLQPMALHHKAGTVTLHSVVMHASVKKHNLQKHGTLLVYQHALQNVLIQLSITWQLKSTLPSTVACQNLLATPTCIPGHQRCPLVLPIRTPISPT